MSKKTIEALALQSPQIIINALAPDFDVEPATGSHNLLRPGAWPDHSIRRQSKSGRDGRSDRVMGIGTSGVRGALLTNRKAYTGAYLHKDG